MNSATRIVKSILHMNINGGRQITVVRKLEKNCGLIARCHIDVYGRQEIRSITTICNQPLADRALSLMYDLPSINAYSLSAMFIFVRSLLVSRLYARYLRIYRGFLMRYLRGYLVSLLPMYTGRVAVVVLPLLYNNEVDIDSPAVLYPFFVLFVFLQ